MTARTGSGWGSGAPSDPVPEPRRIPQIPALDGLRALAVLAVLAFHTGVGLGRRGGFFGVDAFFVVSGFLITSLLVAEWRQTGSVRLGRFWARRCRRLAPALLVVLAAVAAYAHWWVPVAGRSSIRSDLWASLAYVANWRFVTEEATYFGALAAPSPLRHMWSLAIEEQFYLLWPILLVGLLRLGRRRGIGVALGATVVGAAASAVLSVVLAEPGGDPIRVYYGTDTRAQALLAGAALALVLVDRRPVPVGPARTLLTGVGVGGLVATAALWHLVSSSSALAFRGGMTLAALATVAVIASVVLVPASSVARLLAWGPLRWIGVRSYPLYLWHWPVVVVLTAPRTGLGRWSLFGLRIVVTFVLAVATERLIERPIRAGAVRGRRGLVALPAAMAALAVAGILVAPVTGSRLGPTVVVAASSPTTGTDATSPSADDAEAVQVLLVGDSIPFTLGYGFADVQADLGVEVVNAAGPLCGIALGSPLRVQGRTVEQEHFCPGWGPRWADRMEEVTADVAVVLVGRWELVDRMHDGRWSHIGEADYDAYLVEQLEAAVAVLGADGTPVVLVTMPALDPPRQADGTRFPEDDPSRVRRFNQLLDQVAARHPDQVEIYDLFALTAPDGSYTRDLEGIQVRDDDGIHFTREGGQWVAADLFPELVSIAAAHREPEEGARQ